MRRGLGRLVRVAAVVYAVSTVIIVGWVAYDTYRYSGDPYSRYSVRAPDPTKPWERYWTPYTVSIAGRSVGFLEPDEATLNADVAKWAAAHPPSEGYRTAGIAAAKTFGIAAALFAALWASYRGLRWIVLGFIDPPTA